MNTVLQAARRIGTALERLPSPRSLCEIVEAGDYAWLCAWARAVRRDDLRSAFEGGLRWMSRPGVGLDAMEAIGGLLLLLTAEVVRREAREGIVWPPVAEHFDPEVRRFLFRGQYPAPHFIEAIETALRRFGLRHVLGMEGTQSYYLSVYLQFGFTRRGIPMLPFWLTGQGKTVAIQYLLSSPSLNSASFQLLWHGLREFRKGNVPESHIRSVVENSPWTPPGSEEELIRQARAHRELDLEREASDDQEEVSIHFLEEVHLEWNYPSPPRFYTSLVNLAIFDLEAPRYDVFVGDEVVASLIRQPDGSYRYPERIDLPADSSSLVAALVDDRGESQAVQEIVLWDSYEDLGIASFDGSTGQRLDAWSGRMHYNRSYLLLLDHHLQVHPEIRIWRRLNAERTLYRLEAPWDSLEVLIDGEELWNPRTFRTNGRQGPDWLRSVQVWCTPSAIRLGECLRIAVDHPDHLSVDSIRISGIPLAFDSCDGRARTDPFEMSPALALGAQRGGLKVQVWLRKGDESALLVRQLAPRISGVVRSSSRGWEIVDPAEVLTFREARRRLYHFFLSEDQRRDMGVFEGPLFVQRLRSQTTSFEELPSVGGPLTVHKPYNLQGGDQIIQIAREVVDRGVVRQVEEDEEGLMVCLHGPVSPSQRHQVVCWDGENGLRIAAGSEIQIRSDDCWRVPLLDSLPDQFALALAYDGMRIGAWWTESIDRLLQNGQTSPARVAALIRWMHLPVQKREWREGLTRFVQAFPAEAASAWIWDRGLPEDLRHSSQDTGWVMAIRSFFEDCSLGVEQWESFRSCFAQGDPSTPLADVLWRLSFLDPLFMGRLAVMCLRRRAEIDLGSCVPEDQIRLARNRFLGLGAEADDREIRQRKGRILEEAAESMGLNSFFLDHVAQNALRRLSGEALSDLESANLKTALGVQPFRLYLSVKVLDEAASLVRE